MQELRAQFEAAFADYSDELFRHAALRMRDRERALELTQECFMKVWDYAQKGNAIEAWRPFLYKTLRNLIIDEYRRKKPVSLEAMVGEDDESAESLLPADDSHTLERAIERLDGARAVALLPKLPYIYSEVLTLRYVESLTPAEIAAIVGESENAVSVRIHRGLKKLKELLNHEKS